MINYLLTIVKELRGKVDPEDIEAIMEAAQLDYAQAELVSDELQAQHEYDIDSEEEEAEDEEEDDEDT